jgi:hypothetical protein
MKRTKSWTLQYRCVMHGVLVGMGAIPHGDLTYMKTTDTDPQYYTMQTKAGELRIVLYDDWIHMRFEDMDAARALFDPWKSNPACHFNRHSGKYNLMTLAPTVDLAVVDLINHMAPIRN